MYPRYIEKRPKAALQDTPIIFIAGPRQCGKTTLAKQLMQAKTKSFLAKEAIENYLTTQAWQINAIKKVTDWVNRTRKAFHLALQKEGLAH